MFPNLAYTGQHERDDINPEGITERFLLVLAESGFDRDSEPGQLPPECCNLSRPFSRYASEVLRDNVPVRDLFLEG